MPKFGQKSDKDFVRKNYQVRAPRVRVIQDGENLGIMTSKQAYDKARDAGLDLVEVAPKANLPVCHIVDYGKFQYDRSKKEKEKKGVQAKEKEISFRYVIDEHDLETKANQIRKFLEKGFRVKLVVKFKAREKAHKNEGFTAIQKCIEHVGDVASVEKPPGFEGHNITARLELAKSKGSKCEPHGSSSPAEGNSKQGSE